MNCITLLAWVAISCLLTQAEGASFPGVLKNEKTSRETQDELQEQIHQLIDAVDTAEDDVERPDNRRDIDWPWEGDCGALLENCSYSGPYCCEGLTCFRPNLQWRGTCKILSEVGTVAPLVNTD
ncbi:uncharacterized protein LOC124149404 [Haliotis rufescens]|uniref:uncharacterized protein LOC124149404 n=1 Tax=Haliotis rufescens TaxID=6454 RepID=UPI00201F4AA9|nr:uncharacterized protein LOC124149404 [Haliotis rufescens]